MSHISTGGRRGVAAASLVGLLAAVVACGTQQETVLDPGVVRDESSTTPGDQSRRALEADALRAARGQLPDAPDAPAGKRVPDDLP